MRTTMTVLLCSLVLGCGDSTIGDHTSSVGPLLTVKIDVVGNKSEADGFQVLYRGLALARDYNAVGNFHMAVTEQAASSALWRSGEWLVKDKQSVEVFRSGAMPSNTVIWDTCYVEPGGEPLMSAAFEVTISATGSLHQTCKTCKYQTHELSVCE